MHMYVYIYMYVNICVYTYMGLDPEDRQKSLRNTVAYQATPQPETLHPATVGP